MVALSTLITSGDDAEIEIAATETPGDVLLTARNQAGETTVRLGPRSTLALRRVLQGNDHAQCGRCWSRGMWAGVAAVLAVFVIGVAWVSALAIWLV